MLNKVQEADTYLNRQDWKRNFPQHIIEILNIQKKG